MGRKSVETYLEVLDELMLAYYVPVFTLRAKRELSSHPEFFFFDTGIHRALRPTGPLDQTQEVEGAALEGLVGQVLRTWIAARGIGAELYFWRSPAGMEVDFIVYGPDRFMAIEVKNRAVFRGEYPRGLKAFGEDYPEAERVFVYRGADRLRVDGIDVWPAEEWLRQW